MREVIMRYSGEGEDLHDLRKVGDLVRCRECKHRDPEDKKCDCGHDIVWQLPRGDNWYCGDGERKEDTT